MTGFVSRTILIWLLTNVWLCLPTNHPPRRKLPSHAKCTEIRCPLSDKSLRFFLIGDWGGLPVRPFFTLGQKRVAEAMARIGNENNTHFQISLGDNIYTLGAKSLIDKRFKKTFESVYKYEGALQRPWYIIAGNHDYYGNITAELDYTYVSKRWVYPDYNYVIRYLLQEGDITIDIVMIDTVILCGNTKEGQFKNFFQYFNAKDSDRETHEPEDPKKAKELWAWIKNQLKDSTADYLFVAGHYPAYSTAEHGPTPCIYKNLVPLLHDYKVNAYFAGHDHGMARFNVSKDGWTVHHVLSGAGALEMFSKKHVNDSHIPKNSRRYTYPEKKKWTSWAAKVGLCKGSFVYADVGAKGALFQYFLSDLTMEHHFWTERRKKRAKRKH